MTKLATPTFKATVGHRLWAIRISLELSQAAFAASLGSSARAYANWERGEREPPAAFVRALYATHSIDPLWVLCGRMRDATSTAGSRVMRRTADAKHVLDGAAPNEPRPASEKLTPYDPAVALVDDGEIEAFVADALETDDPDYIAQAIGIAERATKSNGGKRFINDKRKSKPV